MPPETQACDQPEPPRTDAEIRRDRAAADGSGAEPLDEQRVREDEQQVEHADHGKRRQHPLGNEGREARVTGQQRDHHHGQHQPADRPDPQRARQRLGFDVLTRAVRGPKKLREQSADRQRERHVGGDQQHRRRRQHLVHDQQQHQQAHRARAPHQRAHQHRDRRIVECDQAALRRLGRQHAGGDGAARGRDRNPDRQSVGDLDQAIGQQAEVVQHRDDRRGGERRDQHDPQHDAQRRHRFAEPGRRTGGGDAPPQPAPQQQKHGADRQQRQQRAAGVRQVLRSAQQIGPRAQNLSKLAELGAQRMRGIEPEGRRQHARRLLEQLPRIERSAAVR